MAKPTKYPWPEMGLGDSRFFPAERNAAGHFNIVHYAHDWVKRRHPDWVVRSKGVSEHGVPGVRITFVRRTIYSERRMTRLRREI